MRPRRTWWILGTALALCSAVLASWVIANSSGGKVVIDGALPGHVSTWGRADVGERLGYGYILVRNTGAEPARLLQADLLPPSNTDQASVVDIRAEVLKRGGLGLGIGDWPTPDGVDERTRALRGFVVPPAREVEIYFIVKLHKPGRTAWTSVQVEYEQAGHAHIAEASTGLAVCAPRNSRCGTPR